MAQSAGQGPLAVFRSSWRPVATRPCWMCGRLAWFHRHAHWARAKLRWPTALDAGVATSLGLDPVAGSLAELRAASLVDFPLGFASTRTWMTRPGTDVWRSRGNSARAAIHTHMGDARPPARILSSDNDVVAVVSPRRNGPVRVRIQHRGRLRFMPPFPSIGRVMSQRSADS